MNFREAIVDYRYLKDRGYPDKAALKLVSDRYRLSGVERNCLFRAVFPAADCHRRRAKLVPAAGVSGAPLGVDWYNVLITVESYLKGFPVFLADDGLLRDSSAIHGSYRPGKVTPAAFERILGALAQLGPASVVLFLDSPISYSGLMAEGLRQSLAALGLEGAVQVEPSADYPLKSFAGIVATSDSSIIDREAVQQVFDLARWVLETSYGARIPAVEDPAFRPSA
ncbi:MAG: DUF434 domain-containing protein [Spirochaetales bacterium]|nr:DUF434 domain-containing protein [Spirochaetales bacterium]